MLSPYISEHSNRFGALVNERMVDNEKNRRSHKISCYVNVMRQCMEENNFKFRNQIFKQTEGTYMGSCLSPLIANGFMRTFKTNLRSSPLFPRIWLRYVDDIFAVTKRENVNETLTWLNSQHPKIQFTFDIEENGSPFLDVMMERSIDRLVFDVYPSLPIQTTHNITKTLFSIP
jgi:hypothetical protein